ncbi:hypothetical protein AKJ09_06964 [Labilithrix luteola]|uniref:Tryptophan synthase alpha chain n=1 Tax=Labilithrix luteola TaxID=1391654 RepID=A0A0K1Q382_9BACT|nr:hypothetical protein [Labilithrix luteola]AKV00301.1 hypothetical protein AKJ09_06964 [Labilithrix luteola]
MNKIRRSSTVTFGLLVLSAGALLAATPTGCATNIRVGDEFADSGSGPSTFVPSDAESAEASTPPSLKLCIATDCPVPYATCADGMRCATNLSNDPKNCGACGEECPGDFKYLNMTSSCVNGACEPACLDRLVFNKVIHYADCNHSFEDGCEVATSNDPKNCGACGNECAPGVSCIEGKCGCDPGMVDCGGTCVDVRNNDWNCGACGNFCPDPTDAEAPPPGMYYGCGDRQCGKLKCISGQIDRYANCDGDITNGCEVYVGRNYKRTDTNNCGLCGNKCAPGQLCWDQGGGIAECGCKPNETLCGSFETSNLRCLDLLNDETSCGSCYKRCDIAGPNQTSLCKKGVCELECLPGWADCDLDPLNGCETNVLNSDAHCGACGNRCDTEAGQPCIEGKCAMKECDGEVPQ